MALYSCFDQALSKTRLLPLLLLSLFTVTSALAHWPNTNATKWVQFPNTNASGYDVQMKQPVILASDFLCTNAGPITDIHIWASFLNDRLPSNNVAFTLSFWSDLPAGSLGTNYSRPGNRLWVQTFTTGQYELVQVVSNVFEQFWNPDPNPPTGILGSDTSIWQYNFYPTNPFVQQGSTSAPTVYWLSVNAIGVIGTTNIGWKTSTNYWNDDSVFARVAGTNLTTSWQPLTDPANTNISLDLAFALTMPQPTNPPCCPDTNGVKYTQQPDLDGGYNVLDSEGTLLASPFVCTNTGTITDIHFWGSWQDDIVDTNNFRWIGIYTNSASNLPGSLVWQQYFGPGQYVQCFAGYHSSTFLNPTNITLVSSIDSQEYYYCFYPTNPLVQQGTVSAPATYWVATYVYTPYNYGWTSSSNCTQLCFHFPTGCCGSAYVVWNGGGNPPTNGWATVTNVSTSGSLPLAFKLTTSTNTTSVTNTVADKWLQVPDTTTNGLDVKATDPKVLADDFRCNATGPITQIRVWTSWINDIVDPNACFCLGLWSDIPRVGTNFSRPGNRLCNWCFPPGQYTNFIYSQGTIERFWDPNIPGTNGLIGSDMFIREYVFDIPTNQQCWQTNGTTYWLSLQADCISIPGAILGWKSCPTNWNDDAVFGDTFSGFNTIPTSWTDLHRPGTTNSVDLSFEIITSQTNTTPPPDTNKWLQIPDATTNGIDVRVTDQTMLADDFRCTATGPITQVRIWGSWLNNLLPPQACFCLGLWSDSPTNFNNLFSTPSNQICNACFFPGQYTNFIYTNVFFEQFWDPFNPFNIGQDSQVWEYIFNLPTNSCWYQTNGSTYWLSLSIMPGCFDQNAFQFGWKTCPTNWNDDGVYGYTPGFAWTHLQRPPGFSNSLDLSFEIITATNSPCPPPKLNCLPNKTVQCGTGWAFDTPTVITNCCSNSYTLSFSAVTNAACPPVITVTWTITDCFAQTANCIQTITVFDSIPPVITCAGNKTVQCGSSWSFDTPTAFDTCCPNVTVSIINTITNTSGCTNIITRFWQALDCCNNPNGCSQTVTVIDTTPPNLTCAANKTVSCGAAWTFDAPTATDLCCGTNVTVTVANTTTNGILCTTGLTITRTWQAVDCCGNFTNCSQVVTIPAVTVPSLVCATNKTVQCGTNWVFDPPFATNSCCTNVLLSVLSTVTNTGCCNTNFVIARAWQATNCCGGTIICTQVVTVVDTNYPALTCASNKTVLCGSAWSFDPPIVGADMCCGTNLTLSTSDSTNGCSITRFWIASKHCYTNACGTNILCISSAPFCSQTVTLIDTNKPTIICPSNLVVLTCSTNISVTWSITATDSCSSVTVTSSPPSGTFFNRDSTNTVIATATDGCGNTNSCSFQIIVRRPTVSIGIGVGLQRTNVIISWVDGGVLEDATNIVGPWTPRPAATSPYTNAITTVQRFYRLRCP